MTRPYPGGMSAFHDPRPQLSIITANLGQFAHLSLALGDNLIGPNAVAELASVLPNASGLTESQQETPAGRQAAAQRDEYYDDIME
jgi:hypothetical protein